MLPFSLNCDEREEIFRDTILYLNNGLTIPSEIIYCLRRENCSDFKTSFLSEMNEMIDEFTQLEEKLSRDGLTDEVVFGFGSTENLFNSNG